MPQALVSVKEHAGVVELHVTVDDAAQVIVLDGQQARSLGDDLFRAGCNTGL